MQLTPIAYARNGFTDKFGIPRQSRPDSTLLTRIVFEPDFRDPNMLRGIEGYSHLWLIWRFDTSGWTPTVRPPRLGGNTRMGVFATRSPFRPNPLGLSSVELLKILHTDNGCELLVRGADLRDGTAIFDIKPYLSFSDSHPDARNGFAEAHKNDHLDIIGLHEALQSFPHEGELEGGLFEILSQDPRPQYQDDPERIYHLDYDGYRVDFRVANRTCFVLKVTPSDSPIGGETMMQ